MLQKCRCLLGGNGEVVFFLYPYCHLEEGFLAVCCRTLQFCKNLRFSERLWKFTWIVPLKKKKITRALTLALIRDSFSEKNLKPSELAVVWSFVPTSCRSTEEIRTGMGWPSSGSRIKELLSF